MHRHILCLFSRRTPGSDIDGGSNRESKYKKGGDDDVENKREVHVISRSSDDCIFLSILHQSCITQNNVTMPRCIRCMLAFNNDGDLTRCFCQEVLKRDAPFVSGYALDDPLSKMEPVSLSVVVSCIVSTSWQATWLKLNPGNFLEIRSRGTHWVSVSKNSNVPTLRVSVNSPSIAAHNQAVCTNTLCSRCISALDTGFLPQRAHIRMRLLR